MTAARERKRDSEKSCPVSPEETLLVNGLLFFLQICKAHFYHADVCTNSCVCKSIVHGPPDPQKQLSKWVEAPLLGASSS